jgi:16S rRNA (adenine1518-N6/adenine1519-N6)-dimethyltransferase
MAQTKQEILAILSEAGSRPRHQFGQNFMIDQNLVRLVADAGAPSPGDVVIEVGPGTGTLTEEILARGAEVVAVEIDRDLAAALRARLGGRSGFRLIEGDALAGKHELDGELLAAISAAKSAGQPVKLVANLPYNVASPLVIELLLAGVDLLAFTVQREVAERLRAGISTEDYGALSVMAQLLADVEILRVLPPQAFWPAPKIESALVRLIRRDRLGQRARPFGQFLQRLFSARRKMLRKTLGAAQATERRSDGAMKGCRDDTQRPVKGGAEAALAALSIPPQARPEEVDPETLLRLYERMC